MADIAKFLEMFSQQMETFFRHFQKLEDTLTIQNDCLIFGNRIVIPEKIRSHVMDLLHLGHCVSGPNSSCRETILFRR